MINKIQITEFEKITPIINVSNLQNKSILITGANGLIASYLIDYLIYLNKTKNINIKIYAMSRSKLKLEQRFKNQSELTFVEQDLNKTFKFNKKIDYIMHTAGNAHPIAFSKYPVDTMKTNLLGTINLLELATKYNAKFLYLSTGEIYGNNIDKKPFTESDLGIVDTKLSRSCYPESKRAAETLCISYNSQYNVDVNIARLCYVYGSTITDTNSRADAQFLRNAINKQNIVMKSTGYQERTYCYVADCISALLIILLNGKNGEFYNIANPNSIVSIKDYASTLAKIANVELVFELPNDIEKKGYSKNADSILDSTKLQNIGWKPFYDIEKGLKNTYLQKKEN